MARICELTGVGPRKGSIIWRSGKSKKSGGIGTHVTAITKRKFMPNLQRVKALINGEEVKFAGFGSFKILTKPQRLGRNPKTGAPAIITARRVASFRPSNEFRQRVAK